MAVTQTRLLAWATLILLCVWFVYRPGLSGDFVFDDWQNIVKNERLALDQLTWPTLKDAALSGFSGPLKRPISMLSFALNRYAVGLDPYYYKVTNVVVHLLNTACVLVFILLLLSTYERSSGSNLSSDRIRFLSLAVCAAWGLHPLNLTAVLYVVQRMTSLSAFFTLLALICYLWWRKRQLDGGGVSTFPLIAFVSFGALGILAKETALLLPLYTFVVEATLLRFRADSVRDRRAVVTFHIIFLGVPALVAGLYLLTHPQWLLERYSYRPFDLPERLLTEARVILFYLQMTFVPNPAQLSLYHDDISLSTGLLTPPTTLGAVVVVLLLLVHPHLVGGVHPC